MSIDIVEWSSIGDLAAAMRKGEISSEEVTRAGLDRIETLDEQTNAVRVINAEAIDIARQKDRERASGAATGPLHGVPVMVKDNLDTGDGMPTTAGSLALADTHASADSPVVAKLRAAGAVLIGKTNLSEWANFRSVKSSSGWSSVAGQVRNPYALDRTPGGSSSGSGVAVAAGYCFGAIGTETSGSIVNPSHMNSVVGIKPTVGLVSRTGIIPISHSQDTAGPMARSVADAAAILTAIAGTDPADAATVDADRHRTDYAAFANPDGLAGKRIGLAVNYCGADERVDVLIADSVSAMRDAGATIVEVDMVPVEDIRPFEIEVMLTEFRAGIDAYLAGRDENTGVRTLADIAAFNRENAAAVMPYYPQDLVERALTRGPLTSETYLKARAESLRLTRTEGLDRTLGENALDAIVSPAGGLPWLIDLANGDNRRGTSAAPAAVSGYPNICVPAGYIYGLPIGLSFVGRAYSEAKLIEIAAGFEHVTRARRAPEFLATADFTLPAPPCLSRTPPKEQPAPW